jgi:hypothetical protein
MVAAPQAVPKQGRPAAEDLFGNVSRLEPNGADAAAKLRAVHAELMRMGANEDAERLLALDKAAGRRDFGTLERMVGTEHPLDQLTEAQHERVRKVIGWRNAIALVPLLITWFFLGWASWAYHNQLDEKPELSTQPFLVLWEQRFGGQVIPTFSATAILAFVLLTVVLAFTAWAHGRETSSNRVLARMRGRLDTAMSALALAAETSTIRPPISAEEWAEAAQRVLTETQRLIAAAVKDTKKLAETNQEISKKGLAATTELHTQGRQELADLHAKGSDVMLKLQEQGREFVGGLAKETLTTMVAVRTENAQLIAGTADQAKLVLQQAGAANRQLVEQQMTPLFEGFSASLRDYRADHEVYRASANAMATGVTELTTAAQTLGSSAGTYAATARSIDEHLEKIQESQTAYATRINENSASMTTAATTMSEVTALLTGRMRSDLELLARNVTTASTQLGVIDGRLVSTSAALNSTSATLEATTRAMQAAANNLAAIAASYGPPAPPSPGLLGRLFGR